MICSGEGGEAVQGSNMTVVDTLSKDQILELKDAFDLFDVVCPPDSRRHREPA
jgi:hypothetical protein